MHTIDHGVEGADTTGDTNNSYVWTGAPEETGIAYQTSATPGVTQTSAFTYDAANHLSSVTIDDGTPSTLGWGRFCFPIIRVEEHCNINKAARAR